jgi:transglutaminase-like putative cysteine protease
LAKLAEGHEERRGVCRDFAHLAVTLSRCMNIPARYCTGYQGDMGVPADPAPMDYSAWYEVFLDGRWFTFDARHNHSRIGRIVADAALLAGLQLISGRFPRTCQQRKYAGIMVGSA